MNGNNGKGAIAIQARIVLTQEIHLIAFLGKLFLNHGGDLQIHIRFGQRDVAIPIQADRA